MVQAQQCHAAAIAAAAELAGDAEVAAAVMAVGYAAGGIPVAFAAVGTAG